MGSIPLFRASVQGLEDQINTGTDAQICQLATTLGLDITRGATTPAPAIIDVATAEPLFLFGSHLSKHKKGVGDVGRELAAYGIELFVAHDTITHDTAWEDEIKKALDHAHAGLVFVHDGLKDSPWCDQEIGWLQGRHVPVMALRFDGTPYGFFAKYQAQPVPVNADAQMIAQMTLNRVAQKPELEREYAASLVCGVNTSRSYAQTDAIWSRLRKLSCLEADLCRQLLDAVKCNRQVHDAHARGWPRRRYTRVIVDFLREQPGAALMEEDIDRYVEFLDDPDPVSRAIKEGAFFDERDVRQRPA